MAPEPELMVHMVYIKQLALVVIVEFGISCGGESNGSFGMYLAAGWGTGRMYVWCAAESGKSVRIFEGGRAER
jgi:hypothetical protein